MEREGSFRIRPFLLIRPLCERGVGVDSQSGACPILTINVTVVYMAGRFYEQNKQPFVQNNIEVTAICKVHKIRLR